MKFIQFKERVNIFSKDFRNGPHQTKSLKNRKERMQSEQEAQQWGWKVWTDGRGK